MVKNVLLLVASLVTLGCASMVYALEKTHGHVCSVDFVAEKVGDPDWVILDGRGKGDYNAGHIPGAVNYGKPVVVTLKHPIDGRLVPVKDAEKLLGEIGLDNKKGLIIYGTKGDYHVTVEQYPIYLGVKKFYYMDGGYEAWTEAGKKVQTESVTPTPAVFKARITNARAYVTTDEMIKIAKKKSKKVSIIDVRSKKEFDAEEATVIRGGRIPGAVLIQHEKNLDEQSKKMLPVEALRELYKDIPKNNTVILYCHRGCRTGYTYYALEWLGYKDIRIYEDGFVVYGNRFDTPIENEHYYNLRPIFVNANNVRALERKVADLEASLEELTAVKASQLK